MKYAIPLGTILLVAAAAALHRSSPPAAGGQPRAMAGPEAREVASSEARPSQDSSEKSSLPVPPPAPVAKGGPPAKPVSWQKLLVKVDSSVELTSIQRSAVEEILKQRDDEIRALHDSVLRSGVVDIRRYDWQADTMKEGWFRKIDALLDRSQHERFLALVEQGMLNEGLAFAVEPGMTVLD